MVLMHEYFKNKEGLEGRIRHARRMLKNASVVHCISGGLDSVGVIPVMKFFGADKIQPVFFNRGQGNYEQEKTAITKVLSIASEVYPDSVLKLIEYVMPIPSKYIKETFKNKESAKQASTKSVYTLRNISMMDECYKLARCLNDDRYREDDDPVFTILSNGNVTTDESFGDGDVKNYKLLNQLYDVQVKGNIVHCYMPYLWLGLSKNEALALAIDCAPEDYINAINASYSCWNPKPTHAEQGIPYNDWCPPCRERKQAFDFAKELGLI